LPTVTDDVSPPLVGRSDLTIGTGLQAPGEDLDLVWIIDHDSVQRFHIFLLVWVENRRRE